MKSVENTPLIHMNMAQKTPSVTSGRSSKHRRKSRKKKANQWTLYIETLKSTIDRLYEMCRIEYSVSGCKEVLLYLQNGTHDFLSLIEAIRLEESFNEENRPQSLAWEIRKSTSSPIEQNNGVQLVMNSLPSFAQVVISNMRSAAKGDNGEEGGGWQLVQRRRRSISSTCTSVTSDTAEVLLPEIVPTNAACSHPSCGRPLSVYERLSGSHHRCQKQQQDTVAQPHRPGSAAANRQSSIALNKARNPKSVMDIPQTKSSMAKISYCRQRIWENEVQPSLAEKLRAKQRREKSNRSISSGSSSVSRSPLKNEINLPATAKPATPLTYSMIARKKPTLDPSRSLQCINEIVESTENDVQVTAPVLAIKIPAIQDTKSEPAPQISPTTWGELELGGDVDWREMTEEEQSLAMEEESIKMEIEKMESELESLDAEISRQRNVDVEIVKSSHKESTTCENICFYPVYKEGREKLQEEFKKFCQESWSEMVEREFAGKIHTPGQVVDKLERIASPSRRRCEKDEENLSKKYEDKLRKAEETRLKLQQDKVSKLKDLSQKREEVHNKRIALGDKIREHIRIRMENNMERAKENRDRNLTEIVRKAKEDEQKVLEVQFINSCVDTNMRQDILDRNTQLEERKQSLADERARKFEEKAAREQAVEQRRKKAAQSRKLLEKQSAKPAPEPSNPMKVDKIPRDPEEIINEEPTASSTIETPLIRTEPAFPRWSELADANKWPSEERKEYRCTICDVTLYSQLEGMAHVIEMDHLKSAGVILSNANSKVMDKQLDLLVELDSSKTKKKETIENTWQNGYRTMDDIVKGFDISVARFEKKLIKDSEAASYGVLRDKCKPLAKLLSLNWKNKPASEVRKLERILIDLLKSFEHDKDNARLLGDSIASDSTLVNQILEILANWDVSALPHRILHKLMLFTTKLTASPKFLLLCIMSKKLLYLADSTTDLTANQVSSSDSTERLCTLLDLFTNLIYRAFYDSLGIDGQPVVWGVSQLEFWELINHILSVLAPIGASLTPLIRQRANTELHEKATRFAKALACRVSFADLKVMSSFFIPLSEKLLIGAIDYFRETVHYGDRSAGSPRHTFADLKGEGFPTTVINLIYSLQIKEALWKKLLNLPLLGFRLFLVMSEAIRSCPVVLTESTFMNELHNLIYLSGCFAARNNGTQILCQLGGPHSILSTISSLPQSFFVHKAWSKTVIASLIAITQNSQTASVIMAQTCSPIYLYNLLKKAKNIKELGDELCYFVPRELWDGLLDFYHSSLSQHNKTSIT